VHLVYGIILQTNTKGLAMGMALQKFAKEEESSGTAGRAGGAIVGSLLGGGINPITGYSGYKGAKDKQEGKNNIGSHMASHAAGLGGISALAGHSIGGPKYALTNGLLGAGMGAIGGAASYGAGRLFGKDKTKKDK